MIYGEPDQAFEKAINSGRLSSVPGEWNYAGEWMYMYTDDAGVDQFKNRISRKYLV